MPRKPDSSSPPRRRVVYREDFSTGPGAWTAGKVAPAGTWHRNILGERGKPVALGWSRTGGRSGGFAFTEPPWYFDDNHGEFMWLYLVFFVNRSDLIGLGGMDLRNAQVDLTIRGHRFDPQEAKLFFWIQGHARNSCHGDQWPFNWALSSRPIADSLRDGQWHNESVALVPDECRWSSMGHLNGGLAGKIKVLQSVSAATGTLEPILAGGHINFGFLLCGIDPNNPPSGRIDLDAVTIRASK